MRNEKMSMMAMREALELAKCDDQIIAELRDDVTRLRAESRMQMKMGKRVQDERNTLAVELAGAKAEIKSLEFALKLARKQRDRAQEGIK